MSAALHALRAGGKRALAEALARIERDPHAVDNVALLDEALVAGGGATIGVTGPPGVGKSTLLDALISRLRAGGMTVAVIAIDPSSVRTGGALLGDRARFASVDPLDPGVFVRSMATRGRLGGLSDLVFPAMTLMRATHDIVLVETVGVGQSEIEIAGLVDTTVLCVQPASGDSLQFLKSGVMEVPDMILVTKSDIGASARRAAAALRSALSVTQGKVTRSDIVLVSSRTGEGFSEVIDFVKKRLFHQKDEATRQHARAASAMRWHEDAISSNFGTLGLALSRRSCKTPASGKIFAWHTDIMLKLTGAIGNLDF